MDVKRIVGTLLYMLILSRSTINVRSEGKEGVGRTGLASPASNLIFKLATSIYPIGFLSSLSTLQIQSVHPLQSIDIGSTHGICEKSLS